MQDELFKDWISAVVGDNSKAFCNFCKYDIKAKYQDLKQHKQTKEHMSACPFKNRTLDSFVKTECDKISQKMILHCFCVVTQLLLIAFT